MRNPYQPLPVLVLVGRMNVGGRTVTAITRRWLPGDSSRCTLCPRCSAHQDVCMLLYDRVIPDAEVPLYDHQATLEKERQERQPQQQQQQRLGLFGR